MKHSTRCFLNVLLSASLVLLPQTLLPKIKTNPIHILKTTTSNNYTAVTINNLFNYYSNSGDGSFNPYISSNEGLEYPKGSGKTTVFEEGIVWGGIHNGTLKVGGSTYWHGLQAGRIITPGATPVADDPGLSVNRVYRVRLDVNPYTPFDDSMNAKLTASEAEVMQYQGLTAQQIYDQYISDWNNWPASSGAPYTDVNQNGVYDPSVDIPGYPGADQTLWYVANDLDASAVNTFSGSSPIGLEMQRTIWAYNQYGPLGNTIFTRTRLINKSGYSVDQMYLAQWADPDLGDYSDDFVGCDTMLNMGYAYNGSTIDAMYGATPPAVGYRMLIGPNIPGTGSDRGFRNGVLQYGYKNLAMTAFVPFINGSSTFADPELGTNRTTQWYNSLQGLSTSGNSFTNPTTGLVTMYAIPGDPVTNAGWIDGSIASPGDRRFAFSSGPFSLAVGDTQEIVIATVVGQGSDRLSSITSLRNSSNLVQAFTYGTAIPCIATVPSFVLLDSVLLLQGSIANPGTSSATGRWVIVSKPSGSTAAIQILGTGEATFTPDVVGTFTIGYQAIVSSSVTGEYDITFNVVLPIAAPQNLTAAAGIGQVMLVWNRSTEADFLKYRIYCGTASGAEILSDSSSNSISATTKIITGLSNGTMYFFRITAVDILGNESGYSNEVSATPNENILRLSPFTVSGQYLNDQIAADTIANGKLPNRVYILQRGGIYRVNSTIINYNWTLRIRANDSTTTKKPTIFFYPSPITGVLPSLFITVSGDVELKNLIVSGYYELADTNLRSLKGSILRIPTTTSGWKIVIDSCILSNVVGTHIQTDSAASVIKVTNTVFANMGYLGNSNLGAGRAIDLRASAIDSLIVQNCTFVNLQDRAIRHLGLTAPYTSNPMKYFLFDHNTIINGMSFHGTLALGNVSGRVIITNNLLLDPFSLGNDTDYTRQLSPEFASSGEKDLYGRNRMTWIYSEPNQIAQWTISNNYYGISDSGQAFYNQYASAGVTGEGSPLTWHINSRLGADSVNAFKKISIVPSNVPALMTKLMRWYRSPSGGNKTKNTPAAWIFGNVNIHPYADPFDYDRKGYGWLQDSLNCSYNASITPISTDGKTVGDTRWNFSGIISSTTLPPPATWNFVSNTGKNGTIAVPSSINPSIGTQSLHTGDAVGVFFVRNDSLICAGYSLWQVGQNMPITAWGDNTQTTLKDGFADGELIQFKIWDSQAGREYNATAQYSTGGTTYTTNGIYALSSLVGISSIYHSISLPQGWNMISSFVAPKDSTIDTLFSKVKNHIVLMKDGFGMVYWPSMSINNIGKWNPENGYQIYMQTSDTLTMFGNEINPQQTPMALSQGWSMVSYLRNSPMRSDSALVSLGSNVVIAKNGAGQVYWPAYTINQIGSMRPGQGYQMYLSGAGTLTYPANVTSAPPSMLTKTPNLLATTSDQAPKHYKVNAVNTGSNAIVLVKTQDAKDGDEVAVLNASKVVIGSGVVKSGQAVVTVWGDNTLTPDVVEGAKEGEELSLTLWTNADQTEKNLTVTALTDALVNKDGGTDLKYKENQVLIATTNIVANNIPKEFLLCQNYPNPFNPTTTLEFGVPVDSKVKVEVYNILGQLIAVLVDEVRQAGYYKVTFGSQSMPSGVYFYRMTAGSFVQTKKMQLIK